MIKIHHVPRARGQRVLWLCEEMGVPYEVAPVAFPPGDDYKKINPIGAVPFLEDDGGVAINESIAMLLYIAQKYGPTPLLPPPSDPRFARVLQMTVFGEATLGANGNILMGAHFFAPPEHKQNWSATACRERLLQGLTYASDVLAVQPFLAGEQFTLADISVGWVLGFVDFLGLTDETPAPLRAYGERMMARPAYQRAAAK